MVSPGVEPARDSVACDAILDRFDCAFLIMLDFNFSIAFDLVSRIRWIHSNGHHHAITMGHGAYSSSAATHFAIIHENAARRRNACGATLLSENALQNRIHYKV